MKPVAEDWAGLYEEIVGNYHRPDREKVIAILENDKIGSETRKWRLQQLDGGRTFNYIIKHHMPRLRRATWICIWVSPEPERAEAIVAVEQMPVKGSVYAPAPAPIPVSYTPIYKKKGVVAVKTNLLYDLVTALNVEVEVPIDNRFSVAIEDVFPWWTPGKNGKENSFRLWEIGVEPRYWFKKTGTMERDRLKGHFAGVYAMSGKYDFQRKRDICYQGEFWSAGVTYGYAVPIGKTFNLEFSASIGYIDADYRHYQPDAGYEHLYKTKTGKTSYFGPTKLKVSLVLPLYKRYRDR